MAQPYLFSFPCSASISHFNLGRRAPGYCVTTQSIVTRTKTRSFAALRMTNNIRYVQLPYCCHSREGGNPILNVKILSGVPRIKRCSLCVKFFVFFQPVPKSASPGRPGPPGFPISVENDSSRHRLLFVLLRTCFVNGLISKHLSVFWLSLRGVRYACRMSNDAAIPTVRTVSPHPHHTSNIDTATP